MRAYEFTKPIEEAKVVEIVPTNEATPNLGAVAGRVGQAMGDLASKGAGAAAAMGQTLNKAKQVGSKVAKSAKAAIKKGQDKVASAILKKGSQLAHFRQCMYLFGSLADIDVCLTTLPFLCC